MTNSPINIRYCQSCGFPLDTKNSEYCAMFYNPENNGYCLHCWKDEEYKSNRSMANMLRLWVDNTDWYNKYAGTNYTPEELWAVLSERLPTLSRWKQKVETHTIHAGMIDKIKNHIDQHLFDHLTIEKLVGMSNLSIYHFRKVFKDMTGENITGYIQRLRMEQIAHLILTTDYTLDEIAQQTGYQNKNSLAKAFKKHFGLSTTEYKKQNHEKTNNKR